MALTISVRIPVTSPAAGHPISIVRLKTASIGNHSPFQVRPLAINNGSERRKQFFLAIKAVDETQGSSESETESNQQSDAKEPEPRSQPAESKAELSELGSEIKKAMEQRKAAEKDDDGLLGGVAEEVREIEWPAFGKVLGTTWVVLGVIAGSSVVLLTLNVVLSELSDRVFAGRGLQDFFS